MNEYRQQVAAALARMMRWTVEDAAQWCDECGTLREMYDDGLDAEQAADELAHVRRALA